MSEDKLKALYHNAFRRLAETHSTPRIEVGFYPYAGIKHTIRRRAGRVYVRLSDIFRNAPVDVHRALASLLVARLLSKTAPAKDERIYLEYARSPRVLRAADIASRRRGRKLVYGARGSVYDLERMFSRLNRRFFDGRLQKPTLSWSQRRTLGVLGHHDAAHETIIINRSLDATDIPDWFVEYVLYHEMLHLKHPARLARGRRCYHTSAFLAEEQRFPYYHEAQDLLDRLAAQRSAADERAA